MTLQQQLNVAKLITGTLASLAILSPAPEAAASIATASLIAASSQTTALQETAAHGTEPCEYAAEDGTGTGLGNSTILGEATTSLAQLGSDAPLAQASVLVAGLGCLAAGGLLLKRQSH